MTPLENNINGSIEGIICLALLVAGVVFVIFWLLLPWMILRRMDKQIALLQKIAFDIRLALAKLK